MGLRSFPGAVLYHVQGALRYLIENKLFHVSLPHNQSIVNTSGFLPVFPFGLPTLFGLLCFAGFCQDQDFFKQKLRWPLEFIWTVTPSSSWSLPKSLIGSGGCQQDEWHGRSSGRSSLPQLLLPPHPRSAVLQN